ncbi:ComEA family DNA-binding protein [Arthrobacter sp. CG_A4]|uniref:ComEA family DNA-binding protein n=1 Tax=Arthrobacter sp. CG_A4 TaxID=3071706 RepID=UPI002DF90044|nr:DNA uptake protein ComE-like DNA-binding protein [Arthrobacter sp. CG_A4]
MTPEEKLCSRTWRLRNSAGVLWSILSFGLLTSVGFLIRGIKAKNKLWIQLGIGFGVIGLALIATSSVNTGTKEAPVHTLASDIWGWISGISFIGGVVLTFVMNRKWLIWKAHSNDSKWYAQTVSAPASVKNSPVDGFDPNAATAALSAAAATSQTSTTAQSFGLEGSSGGPRPLDVNSASVQDLTQLRGVGHDIAQRIVQARQNSGPFSSFEQLVSKAGVQPHLLIPLRGQLVFGVGNSPTTEPPAVRGHSSSRRLDL